MHCSHQWLRSSCMNRELLVRANATFSATNPDTAINVVNRDGRANAGRSASGTAGWGLPDRRTSDRVGERSRSESDSLGCLGSAHQGIYLMGLPPPYRNALLLGARAALEYRSSSANLSLTANVFGSAGLSHRFGAEGAPDRSSGYLEGGATLGITGMRHRLSARSRGRSRTSKRPGRHALVQNRRRIHPHVLSTRSG